MSGEADEPNAVVDFLDLDAEFLTGQHDRDIDLFPVQADAAAGGDRDVAVMPGVLELRQPS